MINTIKFVVTKEFVFLMNAQQPQKVQIAPKLTSTNTVLILYVLPLSFAHQTQIAVVRISAEIKAPIAPVNCAVLAIVRVAALVKVQELA